MLLTYDRFDLIRKLRKNRLIILHGTLLHRATEEERVEMEKAMEADEVLSHVLARLKGSDDADDAEGTKTREKDSAAQKAAAAAAADAGAKQVLRLADFEFSAGGHFMANQEVSLPEGSTRKTHKGYEEVFIPAPASKPMGADEKLVMIADMPEWARPTFKGYPSLNRVQSQLCVTKVLHAVAVWLSLTLSLFSAGIPRPLERTRTSCFARRLGQARRMSRSVQFCASLVRIATKTEPSTWMGLK